jgi:hypothetical protein
MLYFKEKEDMGLDASLKLLDLPPDATIDDANQAYTYLHQMVDLFHREGADDDRGNRQEDMDLLTCAYENAVAYLSDRDSQPPTPAVGVSRSSADGADGATDLHFTINFANRAPSPPLPDTDTQLPEPNNRTVEDAVSITARRLQTTEAALPGAQAAVESATDAAAAAGRRLERVKQARLDAIVAAKSAKSRALLLEIEAKRAMQDAIAVAEKARDRVAAARKAASDAQVAAEAARQQVSRIKQSEQTAAAEVICAEDRLEKEQDRLKGLTHAVLQARHRMTLFHSTRSEPSSAVDHAAIRQPGGTDSSVDAEPADERQQIMADLLEIEASLKSRAPSPPAEPTPSATGVSPSVERRRHDRLAYPPGGGPFLAIDGQQVAVLDVSSAGLRLEPNDAMHGRRIVRGTVAFGGRQPVKVTGKVVHQDDSGLGLKLVTRIGDRLLDRERQRLSA